MLANKMKVFSERDIDILLLLIVTLSEQLIEWWRRAPLIGLGMTLFCTVSLLTGATCCMSCSTTKCQMVRGLCQPETTLSANT